MSSLKGTPCHGSGERIDLSRILCDYVRPATRPSRLDSTHIRCMRQIAMKVMMMNRDLLDVNIPADQKAFVTEDLDRFLGFELTETITRLEADHAKNGIPLEENEILEAVPKEKIRKLACSVRTRMFQAFAQAKASSTTDSM